MDTQSDKGTSWAAVAAKNVVLDLYKSTTSYGDL